MASERGPYMNEDGDWWVAVEDVSSQDEAEAIVRGCAYLDGLEFKGIETTTLSDHEWGDMDCRKKNHNCTRKVPAYHFFEYEPEDAPDA